MSNPCLFALISTALSIIPPAATAATGPSTTHPCASVVQPTERLSCYDAAFPPAANAAGTPITLEMKREQALREFGLSGAQRRAKDPDHEKSNAPNRIEAAIATIRQRPTGERIIMLDNDQVWLLTEVTSKGPLTTGDKVIIRSAALGSFILITPARIPLRTRRLN